MAKKKKKKALILTPPSAKIQIPKSKNDRNSGIVLDTVFKNNVPLFTRILAAHPKDEARVLWITEYEPQVVRDIHTRVEFDLVENGAKYTATNVVTVGKLETSDALAKLNATPEIVPVYHCMLLASLAQAVNPAEYLDNLKIVGRTNDVYYVLNQITNNSSNPTVPSEESLFSV